MCLKQLFKRIINKGDLRLVNSFLGGAAGFGPVVPDYGDVGAGYTGDYFEGPSSGGGIGDSVLQGLSRGLLGSLDGGGSSRGNSSSPRGGAYTDQAKSNMRELLAMALSSFQAPKSLI